MDTPRNSAASPVRYLARARGFGVGKPSRRRIRTVLGSGEAGACEPRDVVQRVRALHPESDAPRRQCAPAADGGDGDKYERGGGGGCSTPEILPMRAGPTEYTHSCARLALHGAEGGTRTPTPLRAHDPELNPRAAADALPALHVEKPKTSTP